MVKRFFQFLGPKVFVLITLGLALWIGHALAQSLERGKRIDKEISSLRNEADKISRENRFLKEKISYFQTDAFQEEEAKKKLNYQNPQEKVVVIKQKPSQDTGTVSEDARQPVTGLRDIRPNYEKWWGKFFD